MKKKLDGVCLYIPGEKIILSQNRHQELYLIEESQLRQFPEKPGVPESGHGGWKEVRMYADGDGESLG